MAVLDSDLAGRAAGQTPREGQSEARTRGPVVRATGGAPDAGLEDRLTLVGRNAGAVVLDEVDDERRVARNADTHTSASVPASVLHHRLQDPLRQVGVQADSERMCGCRLD